MSKRLISVFAIGLLFIGILVPLSISNAQNINAPQVSTSTRFRVVIAAPLTTSVDVWLDGVITTEAGLFAVKPLNVSGYVVTVAGSHTITLDQTGTTTQVGTPFTTSFTAGTNYTVVLLSDMTWIVMTDNNTAPALGMFNARVVNLSANNNPVSVQVDTAVPPMFNAVPYKSASSSYFTAAIGLHSLSIPGSTAKVISYDFQDGHVYSIFIFWDAAKTAPVIIPKSDTTFIKATPTGTVGVTSTPGPTPTVGVGGPVHVWLPFVDRP
jgi:hypothetical protein